MSKHIEFKIRDEGRKVTIKTTERDSYGRLMPSKTRVLTVSRLEFESALNNTTIEVPWEGLL